MKRTVTRADLHDMVWSDAISKLAAREGWTGRNMDGRKSKLQRLIIVAAVQRRYWHQIYPGAWW